MLSFLGADCTVIRKQKSGLPKTEAIKLIAKTYYVKTFPLLKSLL